MLKITKTKKYIYTLVLMVAGSAISNAQKLTKETFGGVWTGCEGKKIEFKMQDGNLWCTTKGEARVLSTDNVGMVDGTLYVDFIVERRNDKNFSDDVAEVVTGQKQDASTMAASVTGQTKKQPSGSKEPSNRIVRHLILTCSLTEEILWVESNIMEEREGYGEIEYRYGNKEKCQYNKK